MFFVLFDKDTEKAWGEKERGLMIQKDISPMRNVFLVNWAF